jgi:integrase
MTFKLPPYLKWRNGRPRWEPGPRLRHAFKGRDLKDEQGNFLGLEAAIAAAEKLNEEVASWRLGYAVAKRPAPRRKLGHTCEDLWELWASPGNPDAASPRWKKLAAVTRRDYKSKIGVFIEEFGDIHVGALAKADLYSWWEDLVRERGHTMANSTISAVRSMLSYAVMKGWRSDNPAKALGLEKVPPRVVVWTPDEIAAIVAKADDLNLFGVADAVIIALHTGQRQGDCLQFEWVSAENGRAKFRQGKTGARVSVPFSPALQERIEAIKARRRSGPVAELQLTGKLVRDKRGKDYTRETFGRDFREVRAAVAADQIKAGASEASVAGKQFLDLRDTAITRLALASCTVPEIRAITGHSLETIHKVLAHYLALDDRMADAAIARLKVWMEEEGIAI